MHILQAMDDPNLFAPWFRDRATWQAWRAFLATVFGLLPETPEQFEIVRHCTGRPGAPPPGQALDEVWLICGRRAGKSFVLALIAVFLACFKDYRQYLQPGERGTVIVVASDRKQARQIFRYARAMLTMIPMLAEMIERETAESFDLNNQVSIEIGTASLRSVRGYTLCAVLGDELAFWQTDDAAEPDYEILDALRPGMSTIPGAMLLLASSPYRKKGALHDAHQRYFGKFGPVLVWKAPTRVMNPSVKQSIIDSAMKRDSARANSEWMAEFRNDIAAFVPRDIVEACVTAGEFERPWSGTHRYVAFVDPSGGSSDSMTLAIGHRETDITIVDVVREITAPFDPESATEEFANLLKSYNISNVTGDRYAGEWPRQAFEKRGVSYHLSSAPKSALYVDMLPKLNSKTIRIPDNPRLINQIAALERRTARGGRDSIDHPPGAHDDLANVVAGVASCIVNRHSVTVTPLGV
ncbi:hypothetical protein IVB11_29915 [Bradyrhizobium sp. 177]|uniref:phage terminase family protein n=1 Tax=Bradyrhizobium sp. 177 TaxID=2782647 RepID=UPI00201BD7C2|nr:phage terminase family protein [Bradyrhizobium sp. 177]MCK1553143.1 hypothetical protein [Bradyrhizobium sp. 177]